MALRDVEGVDNLSTDDRLLLSGAVGADPPRQDSAAGGEENAEEASILRAIASCENFLVMFGVDAEALETKPGHDKLVQRCGVLREICHQKSSESARKAFAKIGKAFHTLTDKEARPRYLAQLQLWRPGEDDASSETSTETWRGFWTAHEANAAVAASVKKRADAAEKENEGVLGPDGKRSKTGAKKTKKEEQAEAAASDPLVAAVIADNTYVYDPGRKNGLGDARASKIFGVSRTDEQRESYLRHVDMLRQAEASRVKALRAPLDLASLPPPLSIREPSPEPPPRPAPAPGRRLAAVLSKDGRATVVTARPPSVPSFGGLSGARSRAALVARASKEAGEKLHQSRVEKRAREEADAAEGKPSRKRQKLEEELADLNATAGTKVREVVDIDPWERLR